LRCIENPAEVRKVRILDVLVQISVWETAEEQSFFKTKQDEEAAKRTSAPDALALVEYVNQKQHEVMNLDIENKRQDENKQKIKNPSNQDEHRYNRTMYN
jgi:hypothetical protein